MMGKYNRQTMEAGGAGPLHPVPSGGAQKEAKGQVGR